MITRRFFVFWAVIALLWANLPYLVGYAASTPQNRFGGFFLYEQDGYSYLAKMRQGAGGAWLFHLPYTSEDEYQSGGIALMFYIVLGKLAALGLNDQLLYHAARVLSSILLLLVLRRFISRFIQNARWQLWTWCLLLFSSGWGLVVSYFINSKYVAYELVAPDAFVFSVLYGPPHVIFGFALLLIWITYTLDSIKADAPHLLRRIAVATVLGGVTALSREAYGPVYAGIFAAYLIALTVQRRRLPWREGLIILLSSIGAGTYGLYMLIAYRAIPGFVVWYAQNPFGSPDPIDFILGYAPLLILAAFGLRSPSPHPLSLPERGATGEGLFIVAWLIAGPIMAYLPLPISRRLIAGWQIPLCIFGAYALLRLIESTRPYRRVIAILALIATLPTTVLVIAGGSMLVAAKQPPLFQPADQLAALDWLSRNTSDRDVVVSDWRFGNVVPTVADARVFIGHPIETAFFKDKQADVARFFDPSTPEVDRAEFLRHWHISLIALGPGESIALDPARFTLVFKQGDYSIYQFPS